MDARNHDKNSKSSKKNAAERLGLPLLKKIYGDVEVEYYPLGKYIVIQPQVGGEKSYA
jgi:hypothetical protein